MPRSTDGAPPDKQFFTRPAGFLDHLPASAHARRQVEARLLAAFARYGYAVVDTPTLDYAELYQRRDIGADLYHKMVAGRIAARASFPGDPVHLGQDVLPGLPRRSAEVILRADMTAPLCRMFAEQMLGGTGAVRLPIRWAYAGQVFRDSKPQPRQILLSEFRQVGVELFGSDEAIADLEVLRVAVDGARAIGLKRWALRLSHARLFDAILEQLGVRDADARVALREAIRQLDAEARVRRLEAVDPRLPGLIVETLEPAVFFEAVGALPIHDPEGAVRCSRIVNALRVLVDALQQDDPDLVLQIAPGATRGIAYYTGVTFEVHVEGVAWDRTDVCGGGRFKTLPRQIFDAAHKTERFRADPSAPPGAPPDVPATGVGLAFGVERAAAAIEVAPAPAPAVYVGFHHGDFARAADRLAHALRRAGLAVICQLSSGVSTQPARLYGRAAALGVRWVVAFAPDEDAQGRVVVRDLDTQAQVDVAQDAVVGWLTERCA